MPIISDRISYNGFDAKAARLGLVRYVDEAEGTLTGFSRKRHCVTACFSA